MGPTIVWVPVLSTCTAKSAELLLVISWGKTVPFNNGAYRNMQDQTLEAMNQVRLSTGPERQREAPLHLGWRIENPFTLRISSTQVNVRELQGSCCH
jgi:hypothetical protein